MAELSPDSANISIRQAARDFFRQLSRGLRRDFWLTMGLLFVGALFEVATVGAVVPFLALMTSSNPSGTGAAALGFVDHLAGILDMDRLPAAALILCLVALTSAAVRLWLSWVTYRFVFTAAREMSMQLYSRVLNQPYPYHIVHNSAQTIGALDKIQQVMAYVIMPGMLALTSAGVALFMIAALVALNPLVAIGSCVTFGAIYLVTNLATKRHLDRNSRIISSAITARIQAMQEGLGGIRDVILDRSQEIFVDKFNRIEHSFRQAQTVNYFIASSPRFVLEAASVILIAALALAVAGTQDGIVGALPVLGAMAIGAQRLLPLLQQIYASWSQYQGSRTLVTDVLSLMRAPGAELREENPNLQVDFARAITLQDVSFQYPEGDGPALRSVDLTIPKGARIGLIGESGSGKSTLVDVIMGLLEPQQGKLLIDGKHIDSKLTAAWQRKIAHVPQNIFLADTSIAANIAFGQTEDAIDMDRVAAAATGADLERFIATLPEGLSTNVGERGVRMSGGQRQRVGIARALYKQAAVLVLDEATSALDSQTEESVMSAIRGLGADLTIIMIAHRLTTLDGCDRIVKLADGRVCNDDLAEFPSDFAKR